MVHHTRSPWKIFNIVNTLNSLWEISLFHIWVYINLKPSVVTSFGPNLCSNHWCWRNVQVCRNLVCHKIFFPSAFGSVFKFSFEIDLLLTLTASPFSEFFVIPQKDGLYSSIPIILKKDDHSGIKCYFSSDENFSLVHFQFYKCLASYILPSVLCRPGQMM